MELFYACEYDGAVCRLDADESGHCVRVLRHRAGDEIHVIDGAGTMLRCRIVDDAPKGVEARVLETFPGWGGHPYRLTVACCPTKNNDRFEWFVEKAVEIGVDTIVPVIGDRSERRTYKPERARRIALAAAKQSLKARIPEVTEPVGVRTFIDQGPIPSGMALGAGYRAGTVGSKGTSKMDTYGLGNDVGTIDAGVRAGTVGSKGTEGMVGAGVQGEPSPGVLKMIAYCFEGEQERRSIKDVLQDYEGTDITVLIGPEGDFSPEEARHAIAHGYIPVHLGTSRLRTETAAVTAAEAVYFRYL